MELTVSRWVLRAVGVPLFLVIGLPAQAMDCAAEFAQDNRFKPAAGAYRSEDTTRVYTVVDGKWVFVRTDQAVTEVVPPASVRFTNNTPLNTVEMVVVDGRKGWQKEGKDGAWEPLPPPVRQALLNAALGGYFVAEGMTALTCSEQQTPDGIALRVYKYQLPADTLGINDVTVTVAYEQAKRIPHSAATQRKGARVDLQTLSILHFDRSIRIAAPVAGGKRLPGAKVNQ